MDSFLEVAFKLSEGNPGALTAIMEIYKHAGAIDPDDALGGLGALLHLDTLEIYGSDLYVLWSDICDRDTAKTLAVLRAVQLGYFDSNTLKDAVSKQDYSGKTLVPVEELCDRVKERLPRFDLGFVNGRK